LHYATSSNQDGVTMARKRTRQTDNRTPPIRHAWIRARIRPFLFCAACVVAAAVLNLSDDTFRARFFLIITICGALTIPFLVDTRSWELHHQFPQVRDTVRQARQTIQAKDSFWDSSPGWHIQALLIALLPAIGVGLATGMFWTERPNWTLFWVLYLPVILAALVATVRRKGAA
jgi:uncharacterized membrane protein YqaE (UPF0057 family)